MANIGELRIVVALKDAFSSGAKKVKSAIGGLKNSMLGAVTAGTLLADALKKTAQVMKEQVIQAISLARQHENIKAGFRDMTKNSEEFFKKLKLASRGAVNDLELMKNTNQAIALGIKQELVPGLVEMSAIVGQALGRTATEAFNDITAGIGRQSRMILDNLGIIVKAESAYKKFAEELGKTAESLTDTERAAAFQQAAMESLKKKTEELGGVLENTADVQINQFKSSLDNLKTTIGSKVTPALGNMASALIPVINNISSLLSQQEEIDFGKFAPSTDDIKGMAKSAALMAAVKIEMDKMMKEGTLTADNLSKSFVRLVEEFDEFGEVTGVTIKKVERTGESMAYLNAETGQATPIMDTTGKAVAKLTEELDEQGEAAENIPDKVRKLSEELKELGDREITTAEEAVKYAKDLASLKVEIAALTPEAQKAVEVLARVKVEEARAKEAVEETTEAIESQKKSLSDLTPYEKYQQKLQDLREQGIEFQRIKNNMFLDTETGELISDEEVKKLQDAKTETGELSKKIKDDMPAAIKTGEEKRKEFIKDVNSITSGLKNAQGELKTLNSMKIDDKEATWRINIVKKSGGGGSSGNNSGDDNLDNDVQSEVNDQAVG